MCLVFEYLPGKDLNYVLKSEHRLGMPQKRRKWVTFYMSEILVALQLLHKENIIYRDLKTDNVVID